ncbi:flagellar motor switch protein FliN/FliY [Desulfosalsimonas propionicica]|uniref:Flagellar motor switch protein FliN n=1 Tax=Desulfosalsimonas propionicica TaxID=332175 RepID=A0A7W0C8V4_9BACT|nr:flagellar motor switch protein FliN [Desulfosalsimonas propionicica]MBA2881310.1 flagellar motor switch protein FliN/FliY [Desulfosalsimonas propionicica]
MADSKKQDAADPAQDSQDSRTDASRRRLESAAGNGGNGDNQAKGIDFLLDVPLQVSVEVGRARMLIKDFLQMKEGGVIELDKLADEPLDLYVNSRLIARGEAVVVNEKFGLRLIDVVSPSERIEKLR